MKKRNWKPQRPHTAQPGQPVPFKPITFSEALARFPPNLRAKVARAHRRKPPCLLCGRACYVVCTFVPPDPQQWGIPEGWQGGCVYTLCKRCLGLPDVQARVEEVLRQGRSKAAAAWN